METFTDTLMDAAPELRAFAISLSGNVDRADDLVQETLLRAVRAQENFTLGTSMRAWLFTILRNLFYSEYRKRKREVEDIDDIYSKNLKCEAPQISYIAFEELREAMQKLPVEQREALLLVGASGLPYDEAAAICNCAVGTIKSRVNRGRQKLKELLKMDEFEEANV